MKHLICLDVDNTLISSDNAHAGAFNEAFKEYGLKEIEIKKLKAMLDGTVGEKIIKKLFPSLSEEEVKKVERIHNNFVIKKCAKKARLLTPNVVKTLRKLKEHFYLVAISNSETREVRALLRGAGIPERVFNKIVGKDKVKYGKPAPDEIFKAEKLMHHKAVLMVGDSIFDVRAGKNAKIKTVSVLTGKFSRKELAKEKPDFIVKNIDVLPVILEKNKIFK